MMTEDVSPPDRVLAAVGGSGRNEHVVETAASLARALGLPWHVVFVETPRTARNPAIAMRAADALTHAVRLGATVSSETAHSVADGLVAQLEVEPASHLVIGTPSSIRSRHALAPTLLRQIATRRPDLTIHLSPTGSAVAEPAVAPPTRARPNARQYAMALAAVLLTAGAAKLLSLIAGGRPLSLLFLLPVIAVAERLGLGPALVSVVAAVLSFDLLLLAPTLHLEPLAPVNIILWIALGGVAIHTSLITGALRNRVALSDRSAQESNRIAAFSQSLARAATWDDTAATICQEFATVLDARAILFREEGGRLIRAAETSHDLGWSPVAQAALDSAWVNGTEAGSGTSAVAAADWRMEPLTTSLGTLAVLALSRDDSANPIRADKAVLSATLASQASLALERLVLEDRWRTDHGMPPHRTDGLGASG